MERKREREGEREEERKGERERERERERKYIYSKCPAIISPQAHKVTLIKIHVS